MDNLEYGGTIYQSSNGSFAHTSANIGKPAEVAIDPTCPAGTTPVAYYRTHAGYDPEYDNEDLNLDSYGLDGYVATPNSNVKYASRANRQITSIGILLSTSSGATQCPDWKEEEKIQHSHTPSKGYVPDEATARDRHCGSNSCPDLWKRRH